MVTELSQDLITNNGHQWLKQHIPGENHLIHSSAVICLSTSVQTNGHFSQSSVLTGPPNTLASLCRVFFFFLQSQNSTSPSSLWIRREWDAREVKKAINPLTYFPARSWKSSGPSYKIPVSVTDWLPQGDPRKHKGLRENTTQNPNKHHSKMPKPSVPPEKTRG